MPDQPETGLGAHRPVLISSISWRATPGAQREQQHRRLADLLGAAEHVTGLAADLPMRARPCRYRSPRPEAQPPMAPVKSQGGDVDGKRQGQPQSPRSPCRAGRRTRRVRPLAHKAWSSPSPAKCRVPAREPPTRAGSTADRRQRRQSRKLGREGHQKDQRSVGAETAVAHDFEFRRLVAAAAEAVGHVGQPSSCKPPVRSALAPSAHAAAPRPGSPIASSTR